jgi:predicted NBD/HSP70 family sugar kinase
VAAQEAFTKLCHDLGEGLAQAVGGLRPDHIIFGGGISKAFSLFGARAEEIYRAQTRHEATFDVAKDAHLPLYGAAAFGFETVAAS